MFTSKVVLATALLLICNNATAGLYSGLATHDQNPLLIPYWIPHTVIATGKNELQVSTSLFITNTLHDETKSNELLIIDVEIYRFDLNLQYELNDWVFYTQIPFISADGGFLDEFIINWHDTFGLPQGDRLRHNNDQLNFQYQLDGKDIFLKKQSYDGIGDISFIAVHPLFFRPTSAWTLGFGLNIPSGESEDFISNQGIDTALWLSYLPQDKPLMLTLGFINPSNNGIFKDQLKASVFFAQTGLEIVIANHIKAQVQMDYHSAFINSKTKALGQSLQIQLGLQLTQFKALDINVFFSEDILVGSAPDITFGLQLDWKL